MEEIRDLLVLHARFAQFKIDESLMQFEFAKRVAPTKCSCT